MIAQVPPPLAATPGPPPTPVPFVTEAPPTSERGLIGAGLDRAAAKAKVLGGTLGAVVIDVNSGIMLDRNGDRSFPMASVQKFLIALVVYGAADEGMLSLDRTITVRQSDVVTNVSPIADDFAKRQNYTVKELISAMLLDSDNTAAKTLMRTIGGVDVLNAAMRNLGYDSIVIGANDDGVATPRALAGAFGDLVAGHVLNVASRDALSKTLGEVQTFPERLRAGFPPGTRLLHKTGTLQQDGVVTEENDAGIAYINDRTIIVVAMLDGAKGTSAQLDEVLAEVARAATAAAATLNPSIR